MNTITLNPYKLFFTKKYKLERGIISKESVLYVLDIGGVDKLFKRYCHRKGYYFRDKIYTLNCLIENKERIDIEELVLPENIAFIKGKEEGFIMELVESSNLDTILSDPNIPFETKIEYLRQVGAIIEKVHKIRLRGTDFLLGDIHEGNFIYDTNRKMIRAVDLDSCRILDNNPSKMYYIDYNDNIRGNGLNFKYMMDENDEHIITKDTEYFSYIMMILNTISNSRCINTMSIDLYYKYLEYLKRNGLSSELLDCFARIYSTDSNTSPMDMLDGIPKTLKIADYKLFFSSLK